MVYMDTMNTASLVARLTDAAPALRVICAWCVDFDPTAPDNKGASHGICPDCAAKLAAVIDTQPVA